MRKGGGLQEFRKDSRPRRKVNPPLLKGRKKQMERGTVGFSNRGEEGERIKAGNQDGRGTKKFLSPYWAEKGG